jgi:tRNA 2-thiouridine synthesizing protein A
MVEKKTIDARGLSSPQPADMTKKVLDGLSAGRVEVLVNSVTARENVIRCGRHDGWKCSFEETDDGYRVILAK